MPMTAWPRHSARLTRNLVVEARGRVPPAFLHVVVIDDDVVVFVRQPCAVLHQFGQPTRPARHLDLRVAAQVAFEDRGQYVVRTKDAAIAGPVDDARLFGLGRVQRHQRIGVIVAEHAGGVRGFDPLFAVQRVDGVPVPGLGGLDRPAPTLLAHVHDVVAKVLEFVVGSRRTGEQRFAVLEEHAAPGFRIVATQVPQSVQNQLVMSARAAMREQRRSEATDIRVLRGAESRRQSASVPGVSSIFGRSERAISLSLSTAA